MKMRVLFEQNEESDDDIVALGRFIQAILKSGGSSQRSFGIAVKYIREHPELDASEAAVALEALGEGRLEEYYDFLKNQNRDLARHF